MVGSGGELGGAQFAVMENGTGRANDLNGWAWIVLIIDVALFCCEWYRVGSGELHLTLSVPPLESRELPRTE